MDNTVNINNFVFDINNQIAELLLLSEKGQLIGRCVVPILSENTEIEFSKNDTRETIVKKIFDTALSLLQGREVSFQENTLLKDASPSLSPEKIAYLKVASHALIDHLESQNTPSSLKKRIEKVVTNQNEFFIALEKKASPLPQVREENKKNELPSEIKPSMQSFNREEIATHLENLEYFKDSYFELSKQILEFSDDLENMDSKTKALCYEFWTNKKELEELHNELSNYHGPEKTTLSTLLEALQKIQGASFIGSYKDFEDQYKKLRNNLASESSHNIEIYLKVLIRNKDAIKKAMESYPLEQVQARLPNEELKLTFYCLVKYQDELQALAKIMSSEKIDSADLNLADIEDLSKLSEKTFPLKKETENFINQTISPQCASYTLDQAKNYLAQATLLINSSTTTPEKDTTLQELLWKSALGFMQNDKPEEARYCLSLAAKHIADLSSLEWDTLNNSLKKEPQFGVNIHGLGMHYNKDHSIHLTECHIDGRPMLKMDFSLNSHGVLGLKSFQAAFDFPDTKKLMEMLPHNFCSNVTIKTRPSHHYQTYSQGSFNTNMGGYQLPSSSQMIIEFEGVGRVIIGNCKDNKCINNMVFIEAYPSANTEQTLRKIQTMVTVLGIPPALVVTRKEDQQRKALLDVFRAFYPREAALIERNGNTYEIEPHELKDLILSKKPEMKERFESHLDNDLLPIRNVENVQGKFTTHVNLSEEMRKKGAIGLMAGMVGDVRVKAPLLSIILKPTKNGGRGMLSSQHRFNGGIIAVGQSSYTDHKEGGAAGVFTRLITKEIAHSKEIKDLPFSGSIQLLFDLDVVNTPTSYGYESDSYGSRSSGNYFSRYNLLELTDKLQRSSNELFGKPVNVQKYGSANEVIIRDGIPSERICGIVVANEQDKKIIIEQLQNDGVLEEKGGIWYLRDIPIEDFVKVGNKFREDMWHE